MAEDLMLHARLMEPISPTLLDESEQVFGVSRLHDVFDACVRDGLLVHVDAANPRTGTSYKPTEQGWLFGNELYGRLWDLRL